MKPWQSVLLGILIGCGFMAGTILIIQQPQGTPIELIPAPTQSPIKVYISGCVLNPGVYEFAQKSRIDDLIAASGGITDCADLEEINLAAFIRDGQQIQIPDRFSTQSNVSNDSRSFEIEEAAYPLNINSASLEDLLILPGIGETRAKNIIKYRELHGPFNNIDELLEVDGIGEKTLEQIRDLISIE